MSSPVADIAALEPLAPANAKKIIKAAEAGAATGTIVEAGVPGIHPGVERWPVKTGTDKDRLDVGRNVLGVDDLGVGVVKTTVEEMLSFKRAGDMPAVKKQFPLNSFYQDRRARPTEVTIWELEVTVTKAKLESDGDYHLVLQGDSGTTMIGEIPNDDSKFVKNAEWLAVIKAARHAVDKKAGRPLPADIPPATMAPPTHDRFAAGMPEKEEPASMTSLNAKARIRGVGFFDSNHGQTGVATATAVEIHPILFIEFK